MCAERSLSFDWAGFDPEAYFQQYYGEPHPSDDEAAARAAAAMIAAAPAEASLDVVDVGTGANLFPLLASLPRARTLTAWEYSPANLAWLEQEIATARLRPQWRHFWAIVRDVYGPSAALPDDPFPLLQARAALERGSIFDLPPGRWDAATMFFCAESVTDDPAEFAAACRAFAGCVRPGGALIAGFLARSTGYTVAGARYPALSITADDIRATFDPHVAALDVAAIGVVDHEIRSGYCGCYLMTATGAAETSRRP